MKYHPRTRTHRHGQRGFTLTELLVAMVIFLILMSGLATMFSAAVDSARQGYASIDAYENARAAMTTIDRDLSGAFVSEEFGDVYSFYGRPDGFMFVGALDEGKLGRVSYVFHPELSKPAFELTITERWGTVTQYVQRQFQRIAREDEKLFGVAAQAFVQNALNVLNAAYNSGGTNLVDDYIEFEVIIQTESLIRLEEIGVTDLDTFNMYVKRNGTNTADITLDWAPVYIDPVEPLNDAPLGGLDANEAAQFEFLLSALNPDPSTTTYDMREVYQNINAGGGWVHPVTFDTTYLRVFGRDTFDTLLRAKKREFWLRMLSGETMGVEDLDPTSTGPESDGNGFWYDEASTTSNNLRNHRVVNEFVVADGIISRAILLNTATGNPVTFNGYPLDALDAEVKFSYGDGKNGNVNFFNTADNLSDPDDPYSVLDVPGLLGAGVGGYSNADLVEIDGELADKQLSTLRESRANLGSPLLPNLPRVITPQLWVTRSKTRPGAPGFRRLFEQSIQVPAASGRTPSSVIARTPGQAL